jgi:hypothetical protein
MGTFRLTQDEFDDVVLGIADYQTNLAEKAIIMHAQGDSDTVRLENESMMLMNLLDALKHYDVDAEIFTDDEIEYMLELATNIVENCPI